MARTRKIRTAIAGLLGGAALVAFPFTQPAQASPSQSYETSVYDNTNIQRQKYNRTSLKGSRCLDRYAERQARAMAAKGRIYHQNLWPILEACKLSTVGENVAFGYPNGKAAVAAWMQSKGHRANILNPRFRLIAVGAYQDSRGSWYVAQVFGRSR
jgi:uncharacterized protein YkwD